MSFMEFDLLNEALYDSSSLHYSYGCLDLQIPDESYHSGIPDEETSSFLFEPTTALPPPLTPTEDFFPETPIFSEPQTPINPPQEIFEPDLPSRPATPDSTDDRLSPLHLRANYSFQFPESPGLPESPDPCDSPTISPTNRSKLRSFAVMGVRKGLSPVATCLSGQIRNLQKVGLKFDFKQIIQEPVSPIRTRKTSKPSESDAYIFDDLLGRIVPFDQATIRQTFLGQSEAIYQMGMNLAEIDRIEFSVLQKKGSLPLRPALYPLATIVGAAQQVSGPSIPRYKRTVELSLFLRRLPNEELADRIGAVKRTNARPENILNTIFEPATESGIVPQSSGPDTPGGEVVLRLYLRCSPKELVVLLNSIVLASESELGEATSIVCREGISRSTPYLYYPLPNQQ